MTNPEHQPEISDRDLAELAALADDRLSPRRRARIEARVAGSPQLAALLEEQRRGAAHLRSVDVRAPDSLRRRVEAERERARKRRPGGFVLPARPALAGGLVAAVAVLALVVALTVPGAGGPSVAQAAQLAHRPQQAGPPPPRSPALLDADVEGVAFPNWTAKFRWRASGRRFDELDGRRSQTVFYEKALKRIGYTILTGDLIEPPEEARVAIREGTRLHYFRDGNRQVVTWPRNGRTCVLSGVEVEVGVLLDLAGWKGKGAVEF